MRVFLMSGYDYVAEVYLRRMLLDTGLIHYIEVYNTATSVMSFTAGLVNHKPISLEDGRNYAYLTIYGRELLAIYENDGQCFFEDNAKLEDYSLDDIDFWYIDEVYGLNEDENTEEDYEFEFALDGEDGYEFEGRTDNEAISRAFNLDPYYHNGAWASFIEFRELEDIE